MKFVVIFMTNNIDMGEPQISKKVNSPLKVVFSNKADMVAYARKGITRKQLGDIAKIIQMPLPTLAEKLPVTLRTIQRYKPSQVFKIPVSDHVIEIAKLYETGFGVFDDKENFIQWMDTSNIAMGSVKPIDLLDTSIGISMIEDELVRIEHGIVA